MTRPNWVYVDPTSIEIFGYIGVRGDKKWSFTDQHTRTSTPIEVKPWDVIRYILANAPRRQERAVAISPQMAVQLYLVRGLTKEHLEEADERITGRIRCTNVPLGGDLYEVVIDQELQATPNHVS